MRAGPIYSRSQVETLVNGIRPECHADLLRALLARMLLGEAREIFLVHSINVYHEPDYYDGDVVSDDAEPVDATEDW